MDDPERQERRKRFALFGLFLGSIVFVGLLFGPFVMANIVTPLTLVAWLLLRIFVLSLPQDIYWWVLIFIAILLVARRFFGSPQAEEPPAEPPRNVALKSIEGWSSMIHVGSWYSNMRMELKRELARMIISMYSSRQQNVTYTEVFEPLQQRQIPLPDLVYDFLFAPDPEAARLTFAQKLRALPQAPRRIWRRWSGQELAEYHRAIAAVLAFMESSLEVSHDDQPVDSSNH